jgi:hypothetical protein
MMHLLTAQFSLFPQGLNLPKSMQISVGDVPTAISEGTPF